MPSPMIRRKLLTSSPPPELLNPKRCSSGYPSVRSWLMFWKLSTITRPFPEIMYITSSITTNHDGLLVVSIRVRDPSSPQEPKLLVLRSQKSDLTKLLVQTLHTTYSHAGVSALVVIIANTYYIPGVRNIVKKVSKSCCHCQLAYSKPLSCLIELFPAFCTTPAPPFFYTGIDFTGPFYVKRGKTRRPEVLKVCLTTKTVHLDLCTDMSTKKFMATLSRFTNRRGIPHVVYSDNGTNFMGARQEIHELQLLMESNSTKSAISHFATRENIQWHHISPRAPHFDGLCC